MLYRISVTERGLTGIANIFRSRLSRLDDLLGAGTVPLSVKEDGPMFSPKYGAGFISILQLIKKIFNVECKKRLKYGNGYGNLLSEQARAKIQRLEHSLWYVEYHAMHSDSDNLLTNWRVKIKKTYFL